MVSHILPVAALAGAAMAACPLSVELTGATGHVAQVAVTNTANEAITVFKGNTVLLDHATKDFVVSDASGKALPFEGSFVKYRKTGIASKMFQTIQPGETVNTEVNTATTYRLAGVAAAKINALQGFHYVTGSTAPTSLKETKYCEATSNTMTIIPDQSKVAEEHLLARAEPVVNSRIQKRSVKYSSCSSSQTSSLQTSVNDAISMSRAAATAAGTSAAYFTTWFKSTSVASKVKSIYTDITGVQTTSPTISCTDTYRGCTDGSALLYTVPSANVVVPCPNNGYWDFPELASNCADDDYDKGGSILHEFSHLYGTDDYAYGQAAAKQLSASQAAANADTYEIYAGSVRLGGCSS
ncbi:Deuterolysin metalloprotease family-domain-containing protein [Xylaria bambusicola]|uniref:Deuterolysin metalloprotease family-domain-containing protein n=1 Tax=Xylaria bambusicola TaxID=326684 RepID=UPI002008AB94|nr:Deuterolysin metalloprotease family-domain-containing protein [Xylaria bambusicola]KAI0526392.1 Deuterolysin metalloprotease family-domain-containing protein [Xylaria bambusicola]